ncbi:helix-turn-helix transcriptional regulator [Rufibacter ruber]|uniref:helix-turn-helix domain-containing protein n=1 Tax=Rufibacter ruber TaxID=1783499 RepID=UPI000A52997B
MANPLYTCFRIANPEERPPFYQDPALTFKKGLKRLEKGISRTNRESNLMATQEIKSSSLAEMKDKFIGKVGTQERDEYEYELHMEVLGKMIKTARQQRNLTQEQLGQLVGVQKAQISKLENSTNSATIDTVLKVFKALKAETNLM